MIRLPDYINSCLHKRSTRELSDRIGSFIGNHYSAFIVAKRYLSDNEHERSPRALVAALAQRMKISPGTLEVLNDPDLQAAIAGQITADFEDEDVVAIDGWLLSRTELRVFAIAALSYPRNS